MANNKVQDAQNEWASHPLNKSNPYRTAQMDLTLWQDHQSKIFTNAKAICDNADNQSQGLNWDQHYSTWHEFVTDEDNVWPIEKFKKDLNEGNRPQRPFDPKHLQKDLIELSEGIFDHALAGPIDVAIRKDGSTNTWDHWHTVLFAATCGITHLRVNKFTHQESDLEKSRIHECDLYYKRNGRNKKSSAEDIFEKETVVSKSSKTPTSKLNVMFESLLISPSGKKSNYTQLTGVESIRKLRTKLSSSYGKTELADKKLKEILQMTMRCFPKETISSTFVRGVSHFLLNFEGNSGLSKVVSDNLSLETLERMLTNGIGTGNKQSYYTSGKDVNDVNAKNQPAEASSIRIAEAWSQWMFNKKINGIGRRPITLKIARIVYATTLSDFEINSKFDNTEVKVEAQCPECDHVFSVKA